MTSIKKANPARDSRGRFVSQKSKILLATAVGDDDFEDDDFESEIPSEVLSEVKALDKELKSEIQITDEVKSPYMDEEETEESDSETEELVEEEAEIVNSAEQEEKRISKAIGNKVKTDCPVDKSVTHPHPAINALKMKIGVKPGEGKGKYAKNELGYLIGDLIYRNGYNDVDNKIEQERCWKQILAEGIECSKTQFKERWISTFKLLKA